MVLLRRRLAVTNSFLRLSCSGKSSLFEFSEPPEEGVRHFENFLKFLKSSALHFCLKSEWETLRKKSPGTCFIKLANRGPHIPVDVFIIGDTADDKVSEKYLPVPCGVDAKQIASVLMKTLEIGVESVGPSQELIAAWRSNSSSIVMTSAEGSRTQAPELPETADLNGYKMLSTCELQKRELFARLKAAVVDKNASKGSIQSAFLGYEQVVPRFKG